MAFEFISDCTKQMYEELKKAAENKQFTKEMDIVSIMFVYYRTVLKQGKFKAQRWEFQRLICEWNIAYATGAFSKQKRYLGGIAAGMIEEYENYKKNRDGNT